MEGLKRKPGNNSASRRQKRKSIQTTNNYNRISRFQDDTSVVNSLSAFISFDALNKPNAVIPPAAVPIAMLDAVTASAAL
ncbi:hypothetical protein [Legionella sainthelensi]|uniref:hypothetical protein n=1 Tax=Legionella sainthelensi TaxID=28087 RepID=UPI001E2F18D3|nr:hypothetical protein [Legionella sainthelensi]